MTKTDAIEKALLPVLNLLNQMKFIFTTPLNNLKMINRSHNLGIIMSKKKNKKVLLKNSKINFKFFLIK